MVRQISYIQSVSAAWQLAATRSFVYPWVKTHHLPTHSPMKIKVWYGDNGCFFQTEKGRLHLSIFKTSPCRRCKLMKIVASESVQNAEKLPYFLEFHPLKTPNSCHMFGELSTLAVAKSGSSQESHRWIWCLSNCPGALFFFLRSLTIFWTWRWEICSNPPKWIPFVSFLWFLP